MPGWLRIKIGIKRSEVDVLVYEVLNCSDFILLKRVVLLKVEF